MVQDASFHNFDTFNEDRVVLCCNALTTLSLMLSAVFLRTAIAAIVCERENMQSGVEHKHVGKACDVICSNIILDSEQYMVGYL